LKLEFIQRRTYGQDRFYPKNEDAKFLLNLMDRQTVRLDQLRAMKAHGWEIEITFDVIQL